jgi:CRP-like cAMP-binding protein
MAREGYDFPYPHREIITKQQKKPFIIDKNTAITVLKDAEIFSSLSDNETENIFQKANFKVFAPGDMIVRQDEEGESLFIVLKGSLSVLINGSVVGGIHGNEIFGEMSLLTGEHRTATVTAVSEVLLIEITKESIQPVIKGNPELLETISSIICRREEKNIEHMKTVERSNMGTGKKQEFLHKLKKFFGL